MKPGIRYGIPKLWQAASWRVEQDSASALQTRLVWKLEFLEVP